MLVHNPSSLEWGWQDAAAVPGPLAVYPLPGAGGGSLVRVSDRRALLDGAPLGRFDMDPPTEAAFDRLCDEERGRPEKVLLGEWSPRPAGGEVALHGWTADGGRRTFVSSAPVVRWYSEREVEACDGQVYVLEGRLSAELAKQCGLPLLAQHTFSAGFPSQWRQMTTELHQLITGAQALTRPDSGPNSPKPPGSSANQSVKEPKRQGRRRAAPATSTPVGGATTDPPHPSEEYPAPAAGRRGRKAARKPPVPPPPSQELPSPPASKRGRAATVKQEPVALATQPARKRSWAAPPPPAQEPIAPQIQESSAPTANRRGRAAQQEAAVPPAQEPPAPTSSNPEPPPAQEPSAPPAKRRGRGKQPLTEQLPAPANGGAEPQEPPATTTNRRGRKALPSADKEPTAPTSGDVEPTPALEPPAAPASRRGRKAAPPLTGPVEPTMGGAESWQPQAPPKPTARRRGRAAQPTLEKSPASANCEPGPPPSVEPPAQSSQEATAPQVKKRGRKIQPPAAPPANTRRATDPPPPPPSKETQTPPVPQELRAPPVNARGRWPAKKASAPPAEAAASPAASHGYSADDSQTGDSQDESLPSLTRHLSETMYDRLKGESRRNSPRVRLERLPEAMSSPPVRSATKRRGRTPAAAAAEGEGQPADKRARRGAGAAGDSAPAARGRRGQPAVVGTPDSGKKPTATGRGRGAKKGRGGAAAEQSASAKKTPQAKKGTPAKKVTPAKVTTAKKATPAKRASKKASPPSKKSPTVKKAAPARKTTARSRKAPPIAEPPPGNEEPRQAVPAAVKAPHAQKNPAETSAPATKDPRAPTAQPTEERQSDEGPSPPEEPQPAQKAPPKKAATKKAPAPKKAPALKKDTAPKKTARKKDALPSFSVLDEFRPSAQPGSQRHRLEQMAFLEAQSDSSRPDDLFAAGGSGLLDGGGGLLDGGLLGLAEGELTAAVTPLAPARGRGRRPGGALPPSLTPVAALVAGSAHAVKTPTMSSTISPGNPLNSVHRDEAARYMVNRKKQAGPARQRLKLDSAGPPTAGSSSPSDVGSAAKLIGEDAAWLLSDQDTDDEPADNYFEFDH